MYIGEGWVYEEGALIIPVTIGAFFPCYIWGWGRAGVKQECIFRSC